MRIVQTLPCVQEDLDVLRPALVEALANGVVHGNSQGSAKQIDICGGIDGRAQLLIAAPIQGDAFDPAAAADPTATENIDSGHSRGVFLMKRLVGEVKFNLGGRR